MRRRSSLVARLNKLEQRHHSKPLRRAVVIAIADMSSDHIVGMSDNYKTFAPRQASEPFEAFERRALSIDPRIMFRVYRTPGAASERDETAEWHSTPSQA